jgi:Phage integrase, N-terminal SAM-like domain
MASIQKRVRNGKTTYCVRYRDPAGKQRRKVFDRKVDAERFRTSNESAKLQGAWVDPAGGKVTFAAQAERWYATTATLKPTTRRDYRSLLDLHVLPRFGDWPLAGIDTLAIREWKAAMVEGGLGGKRAGKALGVLSLVLSSAVEAGKLVTNKAAGVKPPKYQRREMAFLDAAQVEQLAGAIDTRWRVPSCCCRPTPVCGPARSSRSRSPGSTSCAAPCAWQRRRRRSPVGSSGAA